MSGNWDYPVENRSVGQVADVDTRQRLVDVVIAPWDEEAEIFWRGEIWREKFLRGSFDGIETRAGSVRVNREHQIGRTVGKAVALDPKAADGFRGRMRIAKTSEGDDVLSLAEEDMISISGGFVMRPSDVDLNKRTMLRTVKRAFLDHISFVEQPAYEGAKVLQVREGPRAKAGGAGRLVTPNLDEFMNDELLRWADSRRG